MNSGMNGEKKKKSLPVIHAGSSLLLAVLLVLTLSVLALLTFSAGRSDYELSVRMADKASRYYSACNEAEQIRAEVDRTLHQNPQTDFKDLPVTRQDGILFWEVPVDEDQVLRVEVSETSGEILKWQTVSGKSWSGDNSVSVLKP